MSIYPKIPCIQSFWARNRGHILKEKSKSFTTKSSTNLFLSGVVILTIANVMVKTVGLISKIALNRVVGSVGAGYYSSAYEIYAFLHIISNAGLPVALSIMVSKSRARGRFKEAKKIFNISLVTFLVIGTVFAVSMIFLSGSIADLISSPYTTLAIIAISPTILFVCLSSCFRGYFQGHQMMNQTAISQFIEACGKVLVGVGFAVWAKAQGYEDYVVAAFTILGVTIGVFLGMVYLYVKKLFFKEKELNSRYLLDINSKNGFCVCQDEECKSTKQLLKELLTIAIPITISSTVLSLTIIIDTIMVQGRLLAFGMEETLVRVYYGDYTSLVMSMTTLPTVLFYPIASALVPLISSAIETGDHRASDRMRSLSLRVINMIAIPSAIGLSVFSYPLLELLMFKQDSVERAAPWLSVAAISVIFLGMLAATNTFLNTAGYQRLPIISMIVGAAAKLISNYFLVGYVGIFGAPISTIICYLCATVMNVFFTVKYVGKLPCVKKSIVLPFLCSVVAVGVGAGVYFGLASIIYSRIATVISVFATVVLYFFLIFKTKTVDEEDVNMLPSGGKLVNFLKKLKFLS